MKTNQPSSTEVGAVIAPAPPSDAQIDAEYADALARDGVGAGDLGIGAVLNNTNVVLVGFFTSFIYSQLVGVINNNKTWQLALISFSITWVVLAVERFYLYTLGKASWITARSWSTIFRQFLRFLTLVMVFMTTNFAIAVFTQHARLSRLPWHGALALMAATMLLFFYALRGFNAMAF
jgi:hypothetical protein